MWGGGATASSLSWYPYQRTTYQMISPVLKCLMIHWTGYAVSWFPSLPDSLVKRGSFKHSLSDIFFVGFVCPVSLVWGPWSTFHILCGLVAAFVDGDVVRRVWDYSERSDGFGEELRAQLVCEMSAVASCSGGRSTNMYWPGRNFGVTRSVLSKYRV